MTPIVITKVLTAAVIDAVCLSQTPGAAGNLTINGSLASGGVATMTTQRRIIITCAGDEHARTFTLYGTNDSGNAISEALAGVTPGTATSALDYRTITRIAVDAATAGAVRVGTNTTGSSDWKMPNFHLAPFSLAIEMSVSGTVGFGLEYTMSDFTTAGGWHQAAPSAPIVRSTAVAGAAGNASYVFSSPIRGWRVTVASGTGTVTAEAIQAGISGNM